MPDGETFAAGAKALGLGPVVGTRTSGADSKLRSLGAPCRAAPASELA